MDFKAVDGVDRWIVENYTLPKDGVFVDVGAAEPEEGSNSWYFEKVLGWKTLCIEADVRFMAELTGKRKIVEHAIVSNDVNPTFFYAKNRWLSGILLRSEIEFFVGIPKAPSRNLASILDKHKIEEITILSIDTEGTELDVLDSFDMERHKPDFIIIEHETTGLPSNKNAIAEYFKDRPYELVKQTAHNWILKRET